jgi:hypothetical protein
MQVAAHVGRLDRDLIPQKSLLRIDFSHALTGNDKFKRKQHDDTRRKGIVGRA